MISIGIDIGKKGGIFIQNDKGDKTSYKMPMVKDQLDISGIYKILSEYEGMRGIVVFEKLAPIFGSSKTTAFSMGFQVGIIEALCVSLAIPYHIVPPKAWQKQMFEGVDEIIKTVKGVKKRDTKAMALIAVKRRHPDVVLKFSNRVTKDHDGLVDAILLSDYGKLIYKD
jgi:hypothetical protein